MSEDEYEGRVVGLYADLETLHEIALEAQTLHRTVTLSPGDVLSLISELRRLRDENAEPKTLYVVTSGEYSSYQIHAVFSTREKAERYTSELQKTPHSDAEIEEYALDADAEQIARPVWMCEIQVECGAIDNERQTAYPLLAPRGRRAGIVRHLPARRRQMFGSPQNPFEIIGEVLHAERLCVQSYVSAEHARKLAVEARQAHLRAEAFDPQSVEP